MKSGIPPGLSAIFFVFFFLSAVETLAASDNPPRLTSDSLQSLLEQALDAFSGNDFSAAADLFQRLERDFSSEPEYQDPKFRRRMLPLKGHAELAANLPSAAARTFEEFVETFPRDSHHPTALYALGTALERAQQTEAAAERFHTFAQTYPRRPEAALALLKRAELLFILDQEATALDLLDSFSTADAPDFLRHQARLRATRHILKKANLEDATRMLLDYPWEVRSVPEIAALSFAAIELGDLLMKAEKFSDAIRAYRLALPGERLIDLQEGRILEARAGLKRARGVSGIFWSEYYRRLLKTMTRQLTSLRENDDTTASLLLRRGQAMLLAERPHEAWLLFEELALDESLPPAIRQQAHYRWTVAASALEYWEEAVTIARNFLARYPEADLGPQTLHLIARAHQEQRRYPEASEVLGELLAHFPDHALAQRWRFTRGFNRALQEKFPEARSDFETAANNFPDGSLTAKAELWHALTYFFERDYATALTEIESLVERYAEHPLSGEILYRRASTLYAIREYERAEMETAEFVEHFQHHERHGEALVLLGDIRMGAGKLEEAAAAFQKIQPEAGHLFLYGLFQQGKILRARDAHEEMIALFSDYAERTDLEEKPRLSEALYWLGWAHTQMDRKEEAVPLFLAALAKHGDDPASAEIGSILGLLEKSHPLPNSSHSDFSSWIEAERRRALTGGKSTYFSRLNLHLARIQNRRGLQYQEEALLFDIANEVSIEQLGPDALGPIGHLMEEKELEDAERFFDRLLKEYPEAPERAYAYHGLGMRDYREQNYEDALSWFRRFEQETPSHELTSDVLQRAGRALLHLERFEEATAKFEEILSLRSLRGRPHAAALMGLADTMTAAGEPEKAIAYYQRVYTVHRAQKDLVAKAYFESSRLFEALDDAPAAHRTLTEMLAMPELADSQFFEKAREREAELAPQVAAALPEEPE